jgi:DNA-binding transcriptional MerR regulator
MNTTSPDPSYALGELCLLADLGARTVRYYVQIGLVDRPDGETRAARYTARHLEQLLLIRKWSAAGLSLDAIGALLHGQPAPIAPPPRRPGSIEVRSHLCVADGIEIVIEPGRAALTPEQLRAFAKGVMALYADLTDPVPSPQGASE